jgi:uncharacterized protein with PIN domain
MNTDATTMSSARAQVIYRATLDGTANDEMGETEFDPGWLAKVIDFYGYDYIVRQDSNGYIYAERFDHIDIDATGYYTPVERAWEVWANMVHGQGTVVEHTYDHRGMKTSRCPRCGTQFVSWDEEDLDENGDLRCYCS